MSVTDERVYTISYRECTRLQNYTIGASLMSVSVSVSVSVPWNSSLYRPVGDAGRMNGVDVDDATSSVAAFRQRYSERIAGQLVDLDEQRSARVLYHFYTRPSHAVGQHTITFAVQSLRATASRGCHEDTTRKVLPWNLS